MQDLCHEILDKLEIKMNYTHNLMLEKFKSIRTGVANPQILDQIKIVCYQEKMLLKDVSIISVVKGNQICINPFDKNLIPEIMKSILTSKLGITPQNDGITIKLIFPQPTEESRLLLIKEIESIAEETKVSVRNIRRDGNDKIKKIKLDKSSEKFFLDKVQNLHNKWIKNIEQDKIKKSKDLFRVS
ncbi:ribosome-recycling factor [Candidatus Phytoplasma sacchari]|nr:ribosome-recycling factor [Candidatus Phytoplasma sacchari]KAB8122325.1 ribosome recycling factor [Candidatus Phytoplasma sacchari]